MHESPVLVSTGSQSFLRISPLCIVAGVWSAPRQLGVGLARPVAGMRELRGEVVIAGGLRCAVGGDRRCGAKHEKDAEPRKRWRLRLRQSASRRNRTSRRPSSPRQACLAARARGRDQLSRSGKPSVQRGCRGLRARSLPASYCSTGRCGHAIVLLSSMIAQCAIRTACLALLRLRV